MVVFTYSVCVSFFIKWAGTLRLGLGCGLSIITTIERCTHTPLCFNGKVRITVRDRIRV